MRFPPVGCGPFGFGWRPRIPFALRTRSCLLLLRTFVGYQPVGTNPTERWLLLLRTATEFVPASVTYKRAPSIVHEVGAAPKRLPGLARFTVCVTLSLRVFKTVRLSELLFTT